MGYKKIKMLSRVIEKESPCSIFKRAGNKKIIEGDDYL